MKSADLRRCTDEEKPHQHAATKQIYRVLIMITISSAKDPMKTLLESVPYYISGGLSQFSCM